MEQDPIEQILEVIITHPKLFQEHGNTQILNFLLREKQFMSEEKRLLRSTIGIDQAKVKSYLEEYRAIRSIIDTTRNLPLWFFEKREGVGVEWDRNRVFVTINRIKSDLNRIKELVPRFEEAKTQLKRKSPEATRELEILFDRIISTIQIVHRGMQQTIDSSAGVAMIMPEKGEIATFKEQFHGLSDLLDRLEVFIQAIFLPLTDGSPVRLLEGDGLQEAQTRLSNLAEDAQQIQTLAKAEQKT
ncbi:MAG: hypothetical protein ACE5R6_07385 [Candidatus Heimdallarchaeota archaeon]